MPQCSRTRASSSSGPARHCVGNRAPGLAGALAGPLDSANLGRARPAQMGCDLARQRKMARLDAAMPLLHGLGIFDVGRRGRRDLRQSAAQRRVQLRGESIAERNGDVGHRTWQVGLDREPIIAAPVARAIQRTPYFAVAMAWGRSSAKASRIAASRPGRECTSRSIVFRSAATACGALPVRIRLASSRKATSRR